MHNPNDEHKYDDIINLPHHTSKKHPRMPRRNRAAQFSPFAALTGHGEAIRETERITEKRRELDEDAKAVISEKLRLLAEAADGEPVAEITYFVADARKEGGEYVTVTGSIKKIDEYKREVILSDGDKIVIDNIIAIEGAALDMPGN